MEHKDEYKGAPRRSPSPTRSGPTPHSAVGRYSMGGRGSLPAVTASRTDLHSSSLSIHEIITKFFNLKSDGLALVDNVSVLPEKDFKIILGEIAIDEFRNSEGYKDVLSGELLDAEEAIRLSAEASAPKIKGITFKGKVYLKDAMDLGNLIHEAIHFYCGDFFQNNACGGASNGINEGVTEYFARKIAKQMGVTGRNAYSSEVEVASQLVDELTESVLINAYFKNDIQPLKNKYEEKFGIKWEEDFINIQQNCKSGQTIFHIKKRKPDSDDSEESMFGGFPEFNQ